MANSNNANGDAVALLLRRLCESLLGDSSGTAAAAQRVEKSMRYSARILASGMSPSVSAAGGVATGDESAVADAIRRDLQAHGKAEQALKFAELHQKLLRSSSGGALANRWAILHLLHRVSQQRRGTPSSASTNTSSFAWEGWTGDGSSLALGASNASVSLDESLLDMSAGSIPLASAGAPTASGGFWPAAAPSRLSAHREWTEVVQGSEFEVPEQALVRDVVFCCQGIDGQYIAYEATADAYIINPRVGVSRAARDLLRRLCELGWLYGKVKHFVDAQSSEQENGGAVMQALCSALASELREYYRLIAVLEAQSNEMPVTSFDEAATQRPYLTLRRLSVWLSEPTRRMRVMANLAAACSGKKGGKLLAALHKHAQHGDPFVHSFTSSLLAKASLPLYEMLAKWLYRGELFDPHGEFFVTAKEGVKEHELWASGYSVNASMLPPFIPSSVAHLALRTGKGINFLQKCCGSSGGWSADEASQLQRELEAAGPKGGLALLGSQDFDLATRSDDGGLSVEGVVEDDPVSVLGLGRGTGALERVVSGAARKVDAKLIEVLGRTFQFNEHVLAIKRYLLLGQGDFISALMDAARADLDEPASAVSSYALASTVDSAIRASCARYDDPDILGRLRVRMMPHASDEVGWDVFCLEYVTTAPINTILTETAMNRYLRLFNFLWRMKRVEHALNHAWSQLKPSGTTAQFAAAAAAAAAAAGDAEGGATGLTSARLGGMVSLGGAVKRCLRLRSHMAHFTSHFQHYIMFEVLEETWNTFQAALGEASDLDSVIEAHEHYLGSLIEKSLLGARSQSLTRQLSLLLDMVLQFCALAERLHEGVQEVASLERRLRLERDVSTKRGGWGKTGGSAGAASDDKRVEDLARSHGRRFGEDLRKLGGNWLAGLDTFMALLPTQGHVDLRPLVFRLDTFRQHNNARAGGSSASE